MNILHFFKRNSRTLCEEVSFFYKAVRVRASVLYPQPIRICVLGPPAVGKSTIAQKICRHYKMHHVRLRDTISETIAHLVSLDGLMLT